MRRALPLLLLLAVPALAADAPPKLRAGMWEYRTQIPNLPPEIAAIASQANTLCVDDAVQARGSALGQSMAARGQCQPASYSRTAGGWRFTQTCGSGGRQVTTEGVATGDFQSAYDMVITSSAMREPVRTSARHVGACRGLMPGQMRVMGQVVDVLR